MWREHRVMLCAVLAIALTVEGLAWELIQQIGPDDDYERAAFIFRGADGELSLVNWSEDHLFRQARWTGRIPENVVAVVHTHPLRMPRPSLNDIAESQRTGLPFYVVTRMSLCRADPNRRVICSSAKPRPKLGRVSAAADDGLATALQMDPE
jgi:hypothetical protein